MQRQNNREDVFEIQNYLRTIQLANNEKSLINPDGIYGEETTQTVMTYQIRNNIPATGRVDSLTWENIYRDFLVAEEALAPAEKAAFFPQGISEMKMGDKFDEIYALQVLLRLYDKRVGNPEILSITGVFDEDTEKAVKELQKVFGMSQSGRVDKSFWNNIVRFHNNRYFNQSY